MQVPREISFEDLQKLMLKEMCQIVAERVLENSQGADIFRARIAEAHRPKDPAYLQPELPHPLFALDVEQALCAHDKYPHLRLELLWDPAHRDSAKCHVAKLDIVQNQALRIIDGSKSKDNMQGVTFSDPSLKQHGSFKVGNNVCIMTLELIAISKALEYAERYNWDKTVICLDSKSAIQHLARCASGHSIIREAGEACEVHVSAATVAPLTLHACLAHYTRAEHLAQEDAWRYTALPHTWSCAPHTECCPRVLVS
ncbi:hypothetical protein evm_015187 [Chilo suppressalis]|nr:hypothetical protein evm_015187 [Chilo suppressalis]